MSTGSARNDRPWHALAIAAAAGALWGACHPPPPPATPPSAATAPASFCARLAERNDAALALLPRNDPGATQLRRALGQGAWCVATPSPVGGWGISLGAFSVGEGEIWGRWSIEHADRQGPNAQAPATFAPDTTASFGELGPDKPAPRQNLEWSSTRRVIPSSPMTYDFDGDGTPEAIVIVETTHIDESGLAFTTRRGWVWTAHDGQIGLYPQARDIVVEDVRDADGDGRPDLIGRGPFTAFGSRGCGSEQRYPIYGPALLFHATGWGFSPDDAAAHAFDRRDCAAPPNPVIVASPSDASEMDMVASARNVACARLWGSTDERLLAEIGDRCRVAPGTACPPCEDRALLERWARTPVSVHLAAAL